MKTPINVFSLAEWHRFIKESNLSVSQAEQFKQYYQLLVDWNERINLTAITEAKSIINYHFLDSLALAQMTDLTQVSSLADVGTGAGFPGIPLKIAYPHLKLFLIEVSQKKIEFLTEVIQKLGLKEVEIAEMDWRTFLRKTTFDISLFCARASLGVSELLRICKPVTSYQKSQVIYWAANDWQPDQLTELYVEDEYAYRVGSKRRRLIRLSCKKNSNCSVKG